MKTFLIISTMLSVFVVNSHAFLAFNNCCVGNYSCHVPIKGFIIGINSATECRKICDEDSQCEFYTWRPRTSQSGMFGNFCLIYNQCSERNFKCRDCLTGPKTSSCPLCRRNL